MPVPRPLVALALLAVLGSGVAAPAAAAPWHGGSTNPGSIDPPDPYFPALGNAGYDVDHYDLALRTDPAKPRIEGTATITARATDRLTRFNLDLTGLRVRSVRVDGRPAQFTRQTSELRIRPAQPVARDADFRVVVRYGGKPKVGRIRSIGLVNGWLDLGGTSVTLGEPDAASRWFPANDHLRDKATYTFRVTVPKGLVAVANGRLTDKTVSATNTTWVWDEPAPMASYLTELGVGDFTLEEQPGPDGVQLRDAIARPLVGDAKNSPVAQTGEMLTYLSSLFGKYPFATYGVLPTAGQHRARPRAHASMVRQLGHAGELERHLAQRGLRHVRRVALGRPRARGPALREHRACPSSRRQGNGDARGRSGRRRALRRERLPARCVDVARATRRSG